jgi:hypothetical protein
MGNWNRQSFFQKNRKRRLAGQVGYGSSLEMASSGHGPPLVTNALSRTGVRQTNRRQFAGIQSYMWRHLLVVTKLLFANKTEPGTAKGPTCRCGKSADISHQEERYCTGKIGQIDGEIFRFT